jgi:hypothetical protein
MKARIKILARTLDAIRTDLSRAHSFAHERVGFLTAGAASFDREGLLLLGRTYRPVDEEDYERDPSVGVKIGSGAMRKALQAAYRPPACVLHVHTHGGTGRPHFSGVDRRSAADFVPSFFNAVPRMAHGVLVLSDNSASGLLWFGSDQGGAYVTDFITVGAPFIKYEVRDELA